MSMRATRPSRRASSRAAARPRRGAAAPASLVLALAAFAGWQGDARAQDEVAIGEPTAGVNLPHVPLAGEHDALSVSANPAGTALLRSGHAAAVLDLADGEGAAGAGQGFGAFAATAYGGGLLPRLGVGLGVETLRPPEEIVAAGGDATRLSIAQALALGDSLAVGAAYRRFFGPDAVSGSSTWDLGVSSRWGPHAAVGLVVRDLTAPQIGVSPAQRRYEADLSLRPDGTEAFEIGAGGRVGEDEGDVDGWLRASARLGRGIYLRGEYLTRELLVPGGATERDHRLALGLEVSFGRTGVGAYGSGSLRGGDARPAGTTIVGRVSGERVPAVTGRAPRVERLELSGELSGRDLARRVARLRRLAADPALQAVVAEVNGLDVSWATAQELREGLAAISDAGTPVYSHLVNAGLTEYFVATGADQVSIDPAGGLRFAGLSGTRLYYRDVLDRVGVRAEFERVAEYKSAPEQFTRRGPSPEAAEVRGRLFDSLYAQIAGSIARDRDVSRARARELIEGGPYSAGDLEDEADLVDRVAVPDALNRAVRADLGAAYPERGEPRTRPERWSHPAIAVIHISGDIVRGESRRVPFLDQELVGDETVTEAIEQARADPRVRAIVLRIDSPGGSALASEKMAREVFRTRGSVPIICSMGDVAASGGYFAAAGCDAIFAEPTTITGSIGIFTGSIDASALLSRIGVSWETERRGERADMDSRFRGYTDEEREIVRDQLGYYYERFLNVVARGRDMSRDEVHEVARGRVFTGADATDAGLVDELGGLGSAIALAKERAGIDADVPARLVQLPERPLGLLGRILGARAADALPEGIELAIPPGVREILQAVPGSVWVEPGSPQARLPFAIEWED